MELNRTRIVAPEDGGSIRLYPLGDIHLGAAACDVAHLRRTVEQIASDPNAYVILMGDQVDGILPGDPRYEVRNSALRDQEHFAYEQLELARTELDPIKGKVIGIHDGNHEAALRRHFHIDIGKQLSRDWGVPFLEYTALTRLDIEIPRGPLAHHAVWHLDIFSEHGASGGGTPGNALNNLQKRGDQFTAQIFLKGHVHQRGSSIRQVLGFGGKKYLVEDRLFVLTGAFLKGYLEGSLTYSEYKAYAPNDVGSMTVVLDPRSRRMHALNAETVPLLG